MRNASPQRRKSSAAITVALACLGVVAAAAAMPRHVGVKVPHGARLIGQVRIGGGSGGLAVGEGAVWVMSPATATLNRIDPASTRVAAQEAVATEKPCPPTPNVCDEVAAGDNGVWISLFPDNAVARVDPAAGNVVARITVGAGPEGIAIGPGAVWVANRGGPSLSRIDPVTNTVVATIPLAGAGACCQFHMDVTTGGGAVWVTLPDLGELVRVDPAKNTIAATISFNAFRWGRPCAFVVADRTTLWAAGDHCTSSVTRLDMRTNRLTGFVSGGLKTPLGVGLGFGSLWIADLNAKALVRADTRSGHVVGRLVVGGHPDRLSVGFGSIWIRDDNGRVLRFAPHT